MKPEDFNEQAHEFIIFSPDKSDQFIFEPKHVMDTQKPVSTRRFVWAPKTC